MGLKLSRRWRQVLLDWAEAAGNTECCGLLLGQNDVVELAELTANVAAHPTNHFEIDPAALIAAEKCARQGGAQILGYFHSHPNGIAAPSISDALLAVADGRRWLIIAGGDITSWRPSGQPATFIAEDLVEG